MKCIICNKKVTNVLNIDKLKVPICTEHTNDVEDWISEMRKISHKRAVRKICELGEMLGFEVIKEYHIRYNSSRNPSRIDVVYLSSGIPKIAIEIEKMTVGKSPNDRQIIRSRKKLAYIRSETGTKSILISSDVANDLNMETLSRIISENDEYEVLNPCRLKLPNPIKFEKLDPQNSVDRFFLTMLEIYGPRI